MTRGRLGWRKCSFLLASCGHFTLCSSRHLTLTSRGWHFDSDGDLTDGLRFVDLQRAGYLLDMYSTVELRDFRRYESYGEAGRVDEAEPTIHFMQENAITSLLPSGTVTREHYNGSTCSTIDLLLASSDLGEVCEHCGVHPTDRGSDHRAIRAHFVVDTTEYEEKQRKRMYDKADWKKIRAEV
jgi:hypothetical protein